MTVKITIFITSIQFVVHHNYLHFLHLCADTHHFTPLTLLSRKLQQAITLKQVTQNTASPLYT